ncbi:MAG: hypothetical protein RLZZ440_1156 [Planctomycetota bacterium]
MGQAGNERLRRVQRAAAAFGLALACMGAGGGATAAADSPAVAERRTTAFARQPGWTTAAVFASPFATQAAVADADHVYAISNTVIAGYDRTTGRLVRRGSAADARHLNSGFLHDGRIYAAHSNYPAEPHESDIRVFDPASGSLTVFHRFDEPPGSLVWCIRRDGNWWCCFAHYAADNARTVVIEYADGGLDRERQRFLFPAEVVADWDGMSGSGGIWDGDTLLVSHHHFPVLYRLAVPDSGAELELVEALWCPFPGQGFAADPATGGLVGIDRFNRRIVFAVKDER